MRGEEANHLRARGHVPARLPGQAHGVSGRKLEPVTVQPEHAGGRHRRQPLPHIPLVEPGAPRQLGTCERSGTGRRVEESCPQTEVDHERADTTRDHAEHLLGESLRRRVYLDTTTSHQNPLTRRLARQR